MKSILHQEILWLTDCDTTLTFHMIYLQKKPKWTLFIYRACIANNPSHQGVILVRSFPIVRPKFMLILDGDKHTVKRTWNRGRRFAGLPVELGCKEPWHPINIHYSALNPNSQVLLLSPEVNRKRTWRISTGLVHLHNTYTPYIYTDKHYICIS